MKRGDLVTVSLPGYYGKPHAPLFRITVEPTKENGLHTHSQIMIDKTHTVPHEKLSKPFGKLNDEIMLAVNRALAVFLGFAS